METNPYDPSRVDGRAPVSPVPVGGVRTLQIITFAMASGVAVFAAFVLWTEKLAFDGEPNVLCWIALGFAAITFLLSLIVPRISVGIAMKRIAADGVTVEQEQGQKLFPLYQTSHIIACAFLESAAFANLIAYMQSHFVGSIAAGAVLIGLILIRFPTEYGAENWISNRVQDLRAGRLS